VVASSAHKDIQEGDLARHVEGRLRKAALLVEPAAADSGRLVVDISVLRSRSAQGQCAYIAYEVGLRLEEPAVLERSGARLHTVTWRGTSRVSSFANALRAEPVMELVDNQLNALIRAVAKDREPK
jgi:hypothetical protein